MKYCHAFDDDDDNDFARARMCVCVCVCENNVDDNLHLYCSNKYSLEACIKPAGYTPCANHRKKVAKTRIVYLENDSSSVLFAK